MITYAAKCEGKTFIPFYNPLKFDPIPSTTAEEKTKGADFTNFLLDLDV